MFLLLLWFCVCDSEQCRMITIFIAIEMPRAQVVSTPPLLEFRVRGGDGGTRNLYCQGALKSFFYIQSI